MLDTTNMSVCPNTKAMVFKTPAHVTQLRETAARLEKLEEENAKLKALISLMADCFPKPAKAKDDGRYEKLQQLANEL